MFSRYIAAWFFGALVTTGFLLGIPVDLSFVVIDLKYNAKEGVQVCEIQPGSVSKFTGYDNLIGEQGHLAKLFTDGVNSYLPNVWYIERDITDPKIKKRMSELGWYKCSDVNYLKKCPSFKQTVNKSPTDASKIGDYRGIVYARTKGVKSRDLFYKQYPGAVIMDGALFPYAGDKYLMNNLMKKVPEAVTIKPTWGLYEKKYSSALVDKVLNEIPSDYLVIKPRRATRGKGIIIIPRSALKETLYYILTNREKLKNDSDTSYKYWATNNDSDFLIEAFANSDPVLAPHLGNKLYDGTMRVVLLVAYNEGKVEMQILENHWKLPKTSIEEKGGLIDKHRSTTLEGRYAEVDAGTAAAVKRDLEYGFIPLYIEMLDL